MAKGQLLKEKGTGLGGLPNAGSGKRFTWHTARRHWPSHAEYSSPMRREIGVRTAFPYRASGIPQGATP
jgi:hypothetical protein